MDAPPAEVDPLLWMPSDRAWLDPLLVGRQLYTRPTTLELQPGVAAILAPADPQRWGLVVARATNLADPVLLAPWSDVESMGGWQNAIGLPFFASLPLYGPIVMAEWWGYIVGGGSVRVLEVIRQS